MLNLLFGAKGQLRNNLQKIDFKTCSQLNDNAKYTLKSLPTG